MKLITKSTKTKNIFTYRAVYSFIDSSKFVFNNGLASEKKNQSQILSNYYTHTLKYDHTINFESSLIVCLLTYENKRHNF